MLRHNAALLHVNRPASAKRNRKLSRERFAFGRRLSKVLVSSHSVVAKVQEFYRDVFVMGDTVVDPRPAEAPTGLALTAVTPANTIPLRPQGLPETENTRTGHDPRMQVLRLSRVNESCLEDLETAAEKASSMGDRESVRVLQSRIERHEEISEALKVLVA